MTELVAVGTFIAVLNVFGMILVPIIENKNKARQNKIRKLGKHENSHACSTFIQLHV